MPSSSIVGRKAIIDDYSIIESRVRIGEKTLIIYGAQLCNDVTIGPRCVIGGLIGERTRVGKDCRIFGLIVHLQHDPTLGWDDDAATEESAVIQDGAFVGFGATVAGGVRIGRRAYVCAGSVVTRDVPVYHIAFGVNQVIHHTEWKGRLGASRFFADDYRRTGDRPRVPKPQRGSLGKRQDTR